MFASKTFAVGLFAVATLVIAPSAMARVDCRAHDRACLALHRPSTPAERARTRALNREALNAATPVPQAAPPPRADAGYRQSQRQYDRELRDYDRAQRRYELETRRARPRSRFDAPRLDSAERAQCQALATAAPRRGPMVATDEAWAEDHDPFAPTGGQVDPSIAAPTPGLDGAVTGLTQFNARASGATLLRPAAPEAVAAGVTFHQQPGEGFAGCG